MKKIFKTVGLLSLIAFSLFYTEQISLAVKDNDELLKEIESVENQYKVSSVNAYINNNTIIPGLNGVIVDVMKSYEQMQKYGGIFNDTLLEYKEFKPTVSLTSNYDKYIVSGNKTKKEVALAFIVDDNDDIANILQILSIYQIESDFFVTESWFDNNNDLVNQIITKDHEIGFLKSSNISYMYNIIDNQFSEDVLCFSKEEDIDFLNLCKDHFIYTIKPNVIVDKNPLMEVKNSLTNGSIIGIEVTEKLNTELASIIEYIQSKGLEIEEIEELIEE